MTEPDVRVINVLLVEDDPGDVLMTREAFDDYLHNRLDVVTDGAAVPDGAVLNDELASSLMAAPAERAQHPRRRRPRRRAG